MNLDEMEIKATELKSDAEDSVKAEAREDAEQKPTPEEAPAEPQSPESEAPLEIGYYDSLEEEKKKYYIIDDSPRGLRPTWIDRLLGKIFK